MPTFGWLNSYDVLSAVAWLRQYEDECQRGIVHTPEWVAQMDELKKRVKQASDDLRVVEATIGRDRTTQVEAI